MSPALLADTVWVARRVLAMGTWLQLAVAGPDSATALAVSDSVVAEVARWEGWLTTWRSDSELQRLNRAPVGTPVALRPEVAALLAELDGWVRATGGAFDPAVGPWIDAWDLRGRGRVPTAAARARAAAAAGWRHVRADGTGWVRLHPGVWLDSGAFGKGAALRAVQGRLGAWGAWAARVDFGGQLLVWPRGPWAVAAADPRRRDRAAVAFELPAGSASTSSASERFVRASGRRWGHIVDPRTGTPVPAWGSVTVVDTDPLRADVLSTALFVMGPRVGRAWAEARGVAALFLVAGPAGRWQVQTTPTFRACCWPDGRHQATNHTNRTEPWP
jgi:thiamine biosynthesis lipoprotein